MPYPHIVPRPQIARASYWLNRRGANSNFSSVDAVRPYGPYGNDNDYEEDSQARPTRQAIKHQPSAINYTYNAPFNSRAITPMNG